VSETDYWSGVYEACRLLLTAPRMNRAQRKVIEEQAHKAKDQLERRGVRFRESLAGAGPSEACAGNERS
jgi:hypothetical protein